MQTGSTARLRTRSLPAWNDSWRRVTRALGSRNLGAFSTMQNQRIPLTSKRGLWPERAAHRHLPAELTPLIGREQEVYMLCDLLTRPEVRLLTLLGPGGVGKTRLALYVTRRMQQHFSDGVHFVPLAMIRDPGLVLPALAQALHLQESRGYSLLDQVQIALQDRHTLLVFDNFE